MCQLTYKHGENNRPCREHVQMSKALHLHYFRWIRIYAKKAYMSSKMKFSFFSLIYEVNTKMIFYFLFYFLFFCIKIPWKYPISLCLTDHPTFFLHGGQFKELSIGRRLCEKVLRVALHHPSLPPFLLHLGEDQEQGAVISLRQSNM